EALFVALEFGPVAGELEPERRRLGVDAVAAPDHDRVLVLERAALQRRQELVDIVDEDVARRLELHGKTGVEDIARRHPLMDKARLRPDMLGDAGEKGDRLV